MKKQKPVHSALYRLTKLLFAVVVVMLIYLGSLTAYDFGYRVFAEKPVSTAPGKEVEVVIKEGMTVSETADMLAEKGIIRDALIFKLQNKLSHYAAGFKSGTYTLNTSMDNEEIMAVLSGEVS